MSFNATNRMRSRKKDISDSITEIPKTISKTQEIAQEVFRIVDDVGKNLVNLAMFNIDTDILEKFDRQFKEYNLRKNELNRFFEELNRVSNLLKEMDFTSESSSQINDSIINDLQTILTNINESIGSDISSKLEELKSLKKDLETINVEVKQPVEQINESIQLFQKTTDISFEIFTKSMLESLKNSVEMRSITENLETSLFQLADSVNVVPEKMQKSLREEIRSVVNESMVNLDTKIQKVLEEKIKDLRLSLSTELTNTLDQKFNALIELVKTQQTSQVQQKTSKDIPMSRDMQEMNAFLNYLYTWPKNKDEILKKIEEFRDTLLVKRTNDPPFRVTATNTFRSAISEISREERTISENKIRELSQLFENLKRTIENTEK